MRVKRCTFASLTMMLYASFVCCGSWIPVMFVLLRACKFSIMLCRLRILMGLRLLVTACLVLAWCAVACALSDCHPRPMLPGVVLPPFVSLGVLEPKISCSKAWSPIRVLLFSCSLRQQMHAYSACMYCHISLLSRACSTLYEPLIVSLE
jgi:hypothetical protein